MSFEYWFMLPVSIAVAMTAMASAIEGAAFFAPILILALKFPPETAIGIGLITEVFGFASGVFAYARKGLIDYRLAGSLLLMSVPAAFAGSLLTSRVDPELLKTVLGMGLLAVGFSFLRTPEPEETARLDDEAGRAPEGRRAETVLRAADGEEIRYTVCNRAEGGATAAVGGLFMGLISTGLGELNSFFLLQRCRVPSKVSVATGVFVVAVTALAAAGTHLYGFVQSGGQTLRTVFSVVVFTVPGVVIGGQLGAAVASRIPQRVLERALAVLFLLIAALFLGQVLL